MNSPLKKRKRKKPNKNPKPRNVSTSDKRASCKIFTTYLPFLSPSLNEIKEKIMPFCKRVNDNESEFSVPTLFSQQALLTSSRLPFRAKFCPLLWKLKQLILGPAVYSWNSSAHTASKENSPSATECKRHVWEPAPLWQDLLLEQDWGDGINTVWSF